MEAAVCCLHPPKEGGHTHLCAEHFKQWLWEAYPRENLKTPPQTECWICLVEIIQHMWCTGEIPKEMGCIVLVLISKGTTDIQGIGLL